jgi:hypothetical protein
MKKILSGERICLHCGKEMNQKWDEYTPYWECDCPNAVKEREIIEKIKQLESQMPKPKFYITTMSVLINVKNE